MSDTVDCHGLVETITDYLEFALTDARREAIEAHLAKCDGCDAALAQFRRTIEVAGCLRDDDVGTIDSATRAQLIEIFRTG